MPIGDWFRRRFRGLMSDALQSVAHGSAATSRHGSSTSSLPSTCHSAGTMRAVEDAADALWHREYLDRPIFAGVTATTSFHLIPPYFRQRTKPLVDELAKPR